MALLAGLMQAACTGPTADETSSPPSTHPHVAQADPLKVADDAYVVPEPLPTAEPGRVVASSELSEAWVPAEARAWRVLYSSVGVGGELVAVSGVLIAPAGDPPAGGFPVVSWGHGTVGLADQCAPSLRRGRPPVDVVNLVDDGWVVAATDYEGLGTPGLHPYLVGRSAARSVLDAGRAAAQAGGSARVVVWGSSQGGHAALWAGEEAGTYAPDIELLGVVASAPAAELAAILRHALEGGAVVGLVAMAARAYAEVYPDIDLETLLTDSGKPLVPVLEESCSTEAFTAWAEAGRRSLVEDPLSLDAVARRVSQNTPGHTAPASPVLVLQGDNDVVVPVAATDATVDRLCRLGANVDYRRYPADHGAVAAAASDDVLRWIGERRAGGPAASTCSSP